VELQPRHPDHRAYSVGGKQYIAVLAGGTAKLRGAVLYQPSAVVAVFGL
jgi:hypothetical protein